MLQVAKENPTWDYDRIAGALANLGHEVSDTTVDNRTMKEPGTGAAKNGSALLTGLLRCGRCGHKLTKRRP